MWATSLSFLSPRAEELEELRSDLHTPYNVLNEFKPIGSLCSLWRVAPKGCLAISVDCIQLEVYSHQPT